MECIVAYTVINIGLMHIINYWSLLQPPSLVYHNENKIAHNLKKSPTFKNILYPHPLFFNRHMALVPFVLKGIYLQLFTPYKYFSQYFRLSDGEVIIIDWIVCQDIDAVNGLKTSLDTKPIVVIYPGANCSSRDIPGQSYIQGALDRGWIVCIFNRRGLLNTKLTRDKWNIFGFTNDIREFLNYIQSIRCNAILFNIGLSVGSGCLVRFFGEVGNAFSAGVGVTPGYNIEKCFVSIHYLYQKIILFTTKKFLYENKEILKHKQSYEQCMNAANMQELVDHSWSLGDYATREDYYHHTNPMRVIAGINKPML